MAILLGLLIVIAALNAIASAARKSPKPHFVPLNSQLYDSDPVLDHGTTFLSVPADFLSMTGEPVLPERSKPSLLKPVAYTLGLCFTAYIFVQPPALLTDFMRSALSRQPVKAASGVYSFPPAYNGEKRPAVPVPVNRPAENQALYAPDNVQRPANYHLDTVFPAREAPLVLYKNSYSVLKLHVYTSVDGIIALREILDNDLIYALKMGPDEYWACIFFESDAAATEANRYWQTQRKFWEKYGLEPWVTNLFGKCRAIVGEKGTALCQCAQ